MPRTVPGPPPQWILLVEDDTDHVLLMRRALRPLSAELVLEVAPDGPSALARLQRPGPPPALVLLDLNMPRLDGLEVLARIRADAQMAGVPTVMLTTSARDQDRAASLEFGADEFYTKPVSFQALGETLRALVRRYLARAVGAAESDEPPAT